MRNRIKFITSLVGLIAFIVSGQMQVLAQNEADVGAGAQIIESGDEAQGSEFVTISVKNANIAEVLKAYSLQTGQSIVVGPDVVSENVNVRLNNIPWEEALDVILKPYGFGYRVVGDTIVISRLENIVSVEGIEPLLSEVFKLSFVDAYDLKAIVEAQLSGRGKFTILETKGLPGWEFGGQGNDGAATEAGIRQRRKKEQIQKSKVFVVTDVPSAITKISKIIEEIDKMPEQVLIEAKFLEISDDGLSDIGLEYISAVENNEPLPTTGNLSPTPIDLSEDMLRVLTMTTMFPNSANSGASGALSQENGIRLSSATIGDWAADMLFAFISQDEDVNVLSAPKVLTMNNQEAAILVGEKFPIIESQNNSGSGSTVTSTSLDYYENIGIQLNVIPQVCADGYVNMIVHPAVSEIKSFEAGVVTAGSGSQSGTRYPVLKIREAETQIMLKSNSTAVIGGLQTQRDREKIKKIPFIGDIPYLGRLFRRETLTSEKVDLLIFIKSSIIEADNYAEASAAAAEKRLEMMELDLSGDSELVQADEIEEISVEALAAGTDEDVPAMEAEPVEGTVE